MRIARLVRLLAHWVCVRNNGCVDAVGVRRGLWCCVVDPAGSRTLLWKRCLPVSTVVVFCGVGVVLGSSIDSVSCGSREGRGDWTSDPPVRSMLACSQLPPVFAG